MIIYLELIGVHKELLSVTLLTITSAELEELKDAFGFIPLIAGTSFIALIAMLLQFLLVYFQEYIWLNMHLVKVEVFQNQ